MNKSKGRGNRSKQRRIRKAARSRLSPATRKRRADPEFQAQMSTAGQNAAKLNDAAQGGLTPGFANYFQTVGRDMATALAGMSFSSTPAHGARVSAPMIKQLADSRAGIAVPAELEKTKKRGPGFLPGNEELYKTALARKAGGETWMGIARDLCSMKMEPDNNPEAKKKNKRTKDDLRVNATRYRNRLKGRAEK